MASPEGAPDIIVTGVVIPEIDALATPAAPSLGEDPFSEDWADLVDIELGESQDHIPTVDGTKLYDERIVGNEPDTNLLPVPLIKSVQEVLSQTFSDAEGAHKVRRAIHEQLVLFEHTPVEELPEGLAPVTSEVVEAGELIASELAGNVVYHGRPTETALFRTGLGNLLLQFTCSAELINKADAPERAEDEKGRGLFLVVAASANHGDPELPPTAGVCYWPDGTEVTWASFGTQMSKRPEDPTDKTEAA